MKILFRLLLVLVIFLLFNISKVTSSPELTCDIFDTWFKYDGAEKFDYIVIDGNYNLPEDAEIISTITLNDTSIWEYYSISDRAKYFTVLLSLEADGFPLGQHHICVYRLSDLK